MDGGDVRQWTTQDVGHWLQSIEMGAYVDAFESNNIEGEALMLMDDDALRDVGIASIGHRVAIMDAIYQLKVHHNIPLEPGDWIAEDERILALESRVAYLGTSLLRLHEDVTTMARALGMPHVMHAPPIPEMLMAPGTNALSQSVGQGTAGLGVESSAPSDSRMQNLDPAILQPVLDAIGNLLQQRGMDRAPKTPQCTEMVTFNDPCSVLLPIALRAYRVVEDWHNFVLFAVSGGTERCIAYDEKPLMMLNRMLDMSHDSRLVARYASEIESPLHMASRKLVEKRQQGISTTRTDKPDAMRLRAAAPGLQVPMDARVVSTRVLLTRPGGADALSNAHTRGPAADIAFMSSSHAVAIYPYVSDRDDEFDMQPGDTFNVLSKSKGWWALRRDSVADGRGDVYVVDAGQPSVEVWTGWAPAGCLLELTRPMMTILQSQAHLTSPDSQEMWQHTMMYAPLPLSFVPTNGTAALMLTDFTSPDHSFYLSTGDRIRVFKRYNSWSYCIVDGASSRRGWVPTWLVSRRNSSFSTLHNQPNSNASDGQTVPRPAIVSIQSGAHAQPHS